MQNDDAVKVIIRESQHTLTPMQLDGVVERIKEAGVTDEQIREFSCDYFVANSIGFSGEDGE